MRVPPSCGPLGILEIEGFVISQGFRVWGMGFGENGDAATHHVGSIWEALISEIP